jgi:inner membrane protein
MDSLTHIVMGAAIGDLIMGRRAGKKAMVLGAIAASLPDADGLAAFFMDEIDALFFHRGITHSIFVALAAGPLLGWLSWRFFGGREDHLKGWMALFTFNLLGHDLLDTCNVYGTALLLPFSAERIAWNNIYVADPVFSLPMIIATVVLIILKTGNSYRKQIAFSGLILSSVYLAFSFSNQSKAEEALRISVSEKGISGKQLFVTPTLFNTMLWQVAAEDSSGIWMGYYAICDGKKTPELFYLSRYPQQAIPKETEGKINRLKPFARDLYTVSYQNGRFYFNNLRFGTVDGWMTENPEPALAYDLSDGADNSIVVQKGRIRGIQEEFRNSMIRRMCCENP